MQSLQILGVSAHFLNNTPHLIFSYTFSEMAGRPVSVDSPRWSCFSHLTFYFIVLKLVDREFSLPVLSFHLSFKKMFVIFRIFVLCVSLCLLSVSSSFFSEAPVTFFFFFNFGLYVSVPLFIVIDGWFLALCSEEWDAGIDGRDVDDSPCLLECRWTLHWKPERNTRICV